LDKSQQLAEDRLKGDPNDKDAMYWAGVGQGTRATYHFALRKEYIPALHKATAAYNYHAALLKLDPGYVDAYLVVGVNNYVVGCLPWYFKVFASLTTGRHGDRAEGIRQVKRATEQGNYAREDSKLMLAVLYQREKMYPQALALYQEMARSFPRNYLLQYEVSNLLGMTNDWKSAVDTCDSILNKHRAGDSGYENIPIAKVLQIRTSLRTSSARPICPRPLFGGCGPAGGGSLYLSLGVRCGEFVHAPAASGYGLHPLP
jgi:tetratricopeptide (TPR) repeat protein